MRTGLDRLVVDPALDRLRGELRSARVGLLAHPASVDRAFVHARRLLANELGARVTLLLGPEHGYGGEEQDMVGVADAPRALDAESDGANAADPVAVRSLYGDRYEDLSPTREDLARIDLLLVDLQDVGSRYYTFVWTAVLALRAAASAGVRVVVLDRPNPIGGEPARIEGRPQASPYRSFVGLEPIAARHSLTLGEIVAWRAEVEGVPRELLEVVGIDGLAREEHAPGWDRPFVMPSPNMPSYDTALVYPGGCLVEGTNLSEGRGTTRPFEIVGAPWIDGPRLAESLHALGLPGFRARPLTFRPQFQKHARVVCGGVAVHVIDRSSFRPFATYLALVALAHAQDPARFVFRTERYEFRDDVPAFDLLTGDAEARTQILRGDDVRHVVGSISTVTDADRALVAQAVEAGRARRI